MSLDSVWESVRKAKERSMAAQPSKIKSLERHRGSPTPPPLLQTRTSEPYQPYKQPTKLQKGKSYVKYRESPDGLTVTAIFDLPRVRKDDMHVSFQGNRLVVSWRVVKITEREEPIDADDLGSGTRILRELEHKKYCRTIPLPEGTRFEEIRAARDGRHLVLTYPNISTPRAATIVHDGL
jgi:HSP20 family molecular chaperone IbpA